MSESDALLALCACPDARSAATVARSLIAEGLAACVNQVPEVTSIYRWQGEFREDGEVLLLIKTRRERFEALCARIVELHPYEVPEVIAVEIAAGHAPYLEWLCSETHVRV